MADMLRSAVGGEIAAISPDSSVWLAQLDRMWQEGEPGASPLVGSITRYALSPIVIAVWESVAQEMGYPGADLGWEDLMERATADPEFKWSHPAATTASGLLATTAEFYAGAGKLANLTSEDLEAEATIEYVKNIEATVGRYGGESEDKVVARLLEEGGRSLDAFVAQEQLVIYFNQNAQGEKLVAIYPKEGTFWMDHPLVLLEGPWVTAEQRRAFRTFAEFVAEPEQQRLVLGEGYRPVELTVSLDEEGSLIRPEYNVDPAEPKTLLKVPSPGVMAGIREVWRLTKRPANIYVVVDTSGSMQGDKLAGAKDALLSFIDQIETGRDRVALVAFDDIVQEEVALGTMTENGASLKSSVRNLRASGGTALYDAVVYAYDRLQEESDPERINAIVAMTDGQNTAGAHSLESVLSEMAAAGTPVLVFTVAYGGDADMGVLEQIAEAGDGQAYTSDPETVRKLYELIVQFF
jgi:Ca-activated chloride channel family protein